MNKKIAIIGGGNLGTAIAEGLLKSKFCKAQDIYITKRNTITLQDLYSRGVKVSALNNEAVSKSDIIILAVKPYQAAEVINSFKKELTPKHILVSVVTGVLIKDLQSATEKKLPIFRAMPNTAIAIQQSMTCLSFNHASPPR